MSLQRTTILHEPRRPHALTGRQLGFGRPRPSGARRVARPRCTSVQERCPPLGTATSPLHSCPRPHLPAPKAEPHPPSWGSSRSSSLAVASASSAFCASCLSPSTRASASLMAWKRHQAGSSSGRPDPRSSHLPQVWEPRAQWAGLHTHLCHELRPAHAPAAACLALGNPAAQLTVRLLQLEGAHQSCPAGPPRAPHPATGPCSPPAGSAAAPWPAAAP